MGVVTQDAELRYHDRESGRQSEGDGKVGWGGRGWGWELLEVGS
jgi:hypothetical protein